MLITERNTAMFSEFIDDSIEGAIGEVRHAHVEQHNDILLQLRIFEVINCYRNYIPMQCNKGLSIRHFYYIINQASGHLRYHQSHLLLLIVKQNSHSQLIRAILAKNVAEVSSLIREGKDIDVPDQVRLLQIYVFFPIFNL